MFKAIGTNEFSQVYHANGLLEKYKNGLLTSIQEFEHQCDAEEYARNFVEIYPHVRFEILDGSERVNEIYDQEYWSWKDKNNEEWRVLNKKGYKLQKYLIVIFLAVIGIIIAILAHYTSGLPLLAKIVVFPIAVIVTWFSVEYVFAKIC